MRPVVTDGLCGLSSVTIVSPAKTAEQIEIPFGLWTRVGRRNHVLDEDPEIPMAKGNFEGGAVRPWATAMRPFGWRLGVVASVVRRMNEVTLHRARLVLGWVTVFGRVYHHGM